MTPMTGSSRLVVMALRLVLLLSISTTAAVWGAAPAVAACSANDHCYAYVDRGFSPSATLISGNITPRCMNTFDTGANFNTQELSVIGLGSGQWVEFGIIQGGPVAGGIGGTPTTPARWFWGRYLAGTGFQGWVVGTAPQFGASYNATIRWTGSQWEFVQGRTLYGRGSTPAGPIPRANAGAETLNVYNQDSGSITSLTRVQSGVQYFDWANPPHNYDYPPFSSSATTTSIDYRIPASGGAGGC